MDGSQNPFSAPRAIGDGDEAEPLYELKLSLVFYLKKPPGPKRATEVFELYAARFGQRLKRWISTAPGEAELQAWDSGSRILLRDRLLPQLRMGIHWGYAFDDGKAFDAYLFMLHGYKPVSEPGRASFYRFEFPWNVERTRILALARDIADITSFISGVGGYILKPAIEEPDAYDHMFAICRRYWGIDAWNLDMMVHYALAGYTSVNWLTLIGNELAAKAPMAMDEARRAATKFDVCDNGVVLQVGDGPVLGDANAGEDLPNHRAVAGALLPLQIPECDSFGGQRWDEQRSLAWLRRFTAPGDFSNS